VERGAPLGNSSINRKDATFERGQNMAIHPGSKNRALLRVAPFYEEDSYLQFQYWDRTQIEARSGKRLGPHSDAAIRLLSFS
jgi:hypothetical protein